MEHSLKDIWVYKNFRSYFNMLIRHRNLFETQRRVKLFNYSPTIVNTTSFDHPPIDKTISGIEFETSEVINEILGYLKGVENILNALESSDIKGFYPQTKEIKRKLIALIESTSLPTWEFIESLPDNYLTDGEIWYLKELTDSYTWGTKGVSELDFTKLSKTWLTNSISFLSKRDLQQLVTLVVERYHEGEFVQELVYPAQLAQLLGVDMCHKTEFLSLIQKGEQNGCKYIEILENSIKLHESKDIRVSSKGGRDHYTLMQGFFPIRNIDARSMVKVYKLG